VAIIEPCFTNLMLFLTPNQQCHSTEGILQNADRERVSKLKRCHVT